MNLLLDTCAVLHLTLAPERLSAAARDAVSDADNVVFVSPVTGGELACLVRRNRIRLDSPWPTWLRSIIADYRWRVASLTLDTFESAYTLPGDFHDDPCDRIIVATARIHGFTVVTTDGAILNYPHVRSMS